jgi:hypothetical protein
MNDDIDIKRDEEGRFVKGNVSRGRPKGSRNRISAEVREKFQQLVDSYSLDQMKIDLMELEPGERLKVMTNLLDFFIPKLNRTDHSMTIGDETIIIKLPTSDDHRLLEPKDIQPDLPPTSE